MSRFAEPQDPDFASINRSLDFDRRLWPTTSPSRAPMRACSPRAASSPRPSATRCSQDWTPSGRAASGRLPVPRGRRGHPHGGRAPPDRARRPGRRQAATRDARATTRSPPTSPCSPARPRRRRVARIEELMAALVDAAEAHLDWPLPGYTHLQRAQPVYLGPPPARLRLDARHATATASRFATPQVANLPLGAGALAGVNFATDRAMVAAELGLRGRRAELARRRQPTATSSWTTWAPLRPARRTSRASAPSWCCGPARSSASSSSPTPGRVGLVDHAAEEEPGRRRAAAREGAARRRPPERAARGDARAAADLQQGHAGGQGAPLRRGRHAAPEPRRRRRNGPRRALPCASGWRPRPPTS